FDQKMTGIGCRATGSSLEEKEDHQSDDWYQRNIHQGAGGNTPQCSTGALRWIDKSNTAERPQNNPVGFSTHRSTRQGVSKFMQQNNQKKRDVFIHSPNR